jgi:CubicO group peptidase (beta-lactamase class C family)
MSGEYSSKVEEQAKAVLAGYSVPGIAVGLIRDKQLVYARGFGVENIITGKPMTEYSLMEVASLSKMFTGAAIMQLLETGKLGLDEPYLLYVPYFRMADPRYQDITIRHLLAHTSGLPQLSEADFWDEWDDPWDDDAAAARLVRSLDDGLMLQQEPGGSSFLYSDIGYDILAALIQEVTGDMFECYQRFHILEPLQMDKSTFLMSEVAPGDLVAPHVRDATGAPIVWDRYPYARQHAPSSCLFTNIVELSHWVMANINGGVYQQRILQPETQAQLWVPLITDPSGYAGVGYNSGWWIRAFMQNDGTPVRMLVSGGAQPGIATHVTVFPDQGIASIVFVNLLASWNETDQSWQLCDTLAIQMLRG